MDSGFVLQVKLLHFFYNMEEDVEKIKVEMIMQLVAQQSKLQPKVIHDRLAHAKPLLKSETKKGSTFRNWPLVKNPHFLSNYHETW